MRTLQVGDRSTRLAQALAVPASGENAKIALELSLKDVIAQIVEDPEFAKVLIENFQETSILANQENVELTVN